MRRGTAGKPRGGDGEQGEDSAPAVGDHVHAGLGPEGAGTSALSLERSGWDNTRVISKSANPSYAPNSCGKLLPPTPTRECYVLATAPGGRPQTSTSCLGRQNHLGPCRQKHCRKEHTEKNNEPEEECVPLQLITWETKKQDQVFRNLARHAEDHRQLTAPGCMRLVGSQGSHPFIQREALLYVNQEWDCTLVPSVRAPGPGHLAREGEGQHQADHPTWAGLWVLL